jgi:hypothetical protein
MSEDITERDSLIHVLQEQNAELVSVIENDVFRKFAFDAVTYILREKAHSFDMQLISSTQDSISWRRKLAGITVQLRKNDIFVNIIINSRSIHASYNVHTDKNFYKWMDMLVSKIDSSV